MRALLLVDHGSRREAANQLLEEIADALRGARPDQPVFTAHLEIAQPDIPAGFAACVEAGATEVIVVPFFLGPGRHTREDIPRLAEQASTEHGVPAKVAPPLAPSPTLITLLLERFDAAAP